METETRELPRHAGEERVTPLELFFDLVFVLSFTQVTRVRSNRSATLAEMRGA